LFAAILWLFYLALEPYVRRFWPRALISWTRLLSVGPGDPLVGRDLLYGAVWGVCVVVAIGASEFLHADRPVPSTGGGSLGLTLSLRVAAAALLSLPFGGLVLAMASLLLLLVLKLALRRDRLALWCLLTVLTCIQTLSFGEARPLWWRVPLALLIMATFTLLLLRGGLLACATGVSMANLQMGLPLTFNFETWYGGVSLLLFASAAALTLYAFRTAVYGGGARRPTG
jgi:serine/threonine-protein kinase